MAGYQFSSDEIVAKLRYGQALEAEGRSMAELCELLGVSELTYLRWRRKFGDLGVDAVARIQALESENARLRQAVARMEDVLAGLHDAMGASAGAARTG